MQNGSPDDPSLQDERVTPLTELSPIEPSALEPPLDSSLEDIPPPELQHDGASEVDGPPSKKRRITDSTPTTPSNRAKPRPPSPPWKKIGVEGPTSFLDEGRRRSSRTNLVPTVLQPQSEKRQTRAAHTPLGNDAKPATSSPLAVTQLRVDVNGKSGSKATNSSPRVSNTKSMPVKQQRISQSPKPPQSHKRPRSSATANRPRSSLAGASPRQLRDRQSISTSSPTADNFENTNSNAEVHVGECKVVVQRLKIKVKKPDLPIRHPGHVSSKRYSSFREWIDKEDAPEIISSEEALREAQRRNEVLNAVEPGGPLSSEVCSAYIEDVQEEPDPQYSHQDHLVAHALYFCKLMEKEHKRHRQMAKLCAQWCAEAHRKRHKNPEDLLREQQEELRGKRKQLAKDLQRMFDSARAEIDKVRLAQWEEERKVQDQQALDRAIKKSTLLFEKRRSEVLGEMPSDAPSSSDDDGETDYSSNASDGSNMSTSESDSDEEGNADDDAALTAEELRLKYSNIPEVTPDQDQMSVVTTSVFESEADSMATPVDAPLEDGSDQSTDMESDMGDEEDEEDEDSDNERNGLLAFFSTKKANREAEEDSTDDDDYEYKAPALELQSEKEDNDNDEDEEPDRLSLFPDGLSVPGTSTEATPMEIEEESEAAQLTPGDSEDIDMIDTPMGDVPSIADGSASAAPGIEIRPTEDISSEPSPGTFATKPSEPESVSSFEPPVENALQTSHSPGPGLQTQIPHLLRGTLREYQHYGLDWLAGLYKNHINGILADEMGLGKTIQTIALLAHLAVDHGVWGPHLVVVPTSVILNWEMEFKKWCPGFKIMTYYGNQEERKIKRKGWTDDNSWNVLITSYQLALQDQISLKRRSWHYMVLDEAHNIKNFRSQRWQALLTFRTRARLLLTGTPLQNNLTELWSLLFFLMPTDGEGNNGIEGFADLRDFSEWFRRPVEQILEHGRETMDDEAKKVVTKLHTVLRPYILRRLKADVEKQMPGKYEHVVYCRLSKRQRYLYDGFMSMAQTKETLASGNFLSIIHCLMQLRKVCNHPDLFETRPISTSFAMPRSVVTDYNVKESLVRRRLLFDHPLAKVDLDFLNLAPVSREDISKRLADDSIRLMAFGPFKTLRELQYNRTNWKMTFDGSSMETILTSLENVCRKRRMAELERCLYFESKRHGRRPVYGSSLFEFMRAGTSKMHALTNAPLRKRDMAEWLMTRSSVLAAIILTVEERSLEMDGFVQRFACVTPAVVASGMTEAALTPVETRLLTNTAKEQPYDPFHEARMRLSIAFPDRRLLQYDCGKLQRLDKLLRDLKAGGHRALIFTQMTKMLDILEQFLNIHGHRYLRLDGTTKVEARQMLTERFNSDPRILAFILSSRSGGLGINLTGADTVIFYDLDWNPAMDKQCQDRCHRIGQTRDVHIYRFVSEYTIESNILRKANQKRMLDDVIIQEGEFTTDYFTKLDTQDPIETDERDGKDEASAAMDRVLGNRVGGTRGFEQAEDKEDIDAAKNAEKELQHADDGDFDDRTSHGTPAQIGTPLAADDGSRPGPGPGPGPRDNAEALGDIDDYILRFMWWNMRDEPVVPPMDKSKKRSKKGKEHNLKRRR
ncbi:hypothetical protein N7495_007224 [Penicillium taxi]|uniref:uncharacterized protein n=1 Tax=Penicillium taxi TaxID=168475 RepID=UPI002544DEF2|nr:uncharacterized protein N7495_007224 [Penicillium taxi]KAJ5895533.1 hypothetical protein N7495_007224 [Penicillium taxi]